VTVATPYDRVLASKIDERFRSGGLDDPRAENPWMRGWLGDPKAAAWFISEAPSRWRIDREAPKAPRTPEDQWALSPGDKEFRKALAFGGIQRGRPVQPWRLALIHHSALEILC